MAKKYGVDVMMLSCGRLQLYNAFAEEHKTTHLNKKIEEIYKEVGGKEIRENYLCLEVVAEACDDG
jgi:lysyl-tRNA synthetase class I